MTAEFVSLSYYILFSDENEQLMDANNAALKSNAKGTNVLFHFPTEKLTKFIPPLGYGIMIPRPNKNKICLNMNFIIELFF